MPNLSSIFINRPVETTTIIMVGSLWYFLTPVSLNMYSPPGLKEIVSFVVSTAMLIAVVIYKVGFLKLIYVDGIERKMARVIFAEGKKLFAHYLVVNVMIFVAIMIIGGIVSFVSRQMSFPSNLISTLIPILILLKLIILSPSLVIAAGHNARNAISATKLYPLKSIPKHIIVVGLLSYLVWNVQPYIDTYMSDPYALMMPQLIAASLLEFYLLVEVMKYLRNQQEKELA